MRQDFYFPSCGEGQIHGCRWETEGQPRAVVQLVHGIAEYVERYDDFAQYLNDRGFLVVAEDHMGHGKSADTGTLGYFAGGWFSAAADSYRLLSDTRRELPEVPYFLFGHSMGSFLTRTILARYPDSGIRGAVICGTAWQPSALLPVGIGACRMACRRNGERTSSPKLEHLVFGGYNRRVEHKRTEFDWLTRDTAVVDRYLADPLCGFTPTAGLLRDMLTGISWIQRPENLAKMRKDLPVLFLAGGDDPVGNYGKGVRHAAQMFRRSGMTQVSQKIYPLGRHEILNELNRQEVYRRR